MTDGGRFLPYGRQSLDDADRAAVMKVLNGEWLTQGPAVAAFERGLAEKTGAPFAVSCANGTAALHIACLALEPQPGDAAIVPSVTFLATATAAHHAGFRVVFADVDPASGLMTPETAEAAVKAARTLGLRPRVFLPVHLAGATVDLPAVAAVAAAHGAVLIEDACHALGTVDRRINGAAEPVGGCAWSAMTAFSFHPVKTVAAAEGGAVTARDPALARRLECLRNHGMTRDPQDFVTPELAFDGAGEANPWHYEQLVPGFNYRLSDLHAALGLSQLDKLEAFAARRRDRRDLYAARFAADPDGFVRMADPPPWCRPVWHLAQVRVDFARAGRSRAEVMRTLRAAGIGTQVHYIPVHRQPLWRKLAPEAQAPGADAFFAETLSLPLFVDMTAMDVDRIVAALRAALKPA